MTISRRSFITFMSGAAVVSLIDPLALLPSPDAPFGIEPDPDAPSTKYLYENWENLGRGGRSLTISDDFEISGSGDIRYVGDGDTTYTVSEFHQFLLGEADDSKWGMIPAPQTDQVVTLFGEWNIDDDTANHLRDGSIRQRGGIYMGAVAWG